MSPELFRLSAGKRGTTPGIRPAGGPVGDQKRVATPAAAIEEGADLLVVGRPVTGAPDPAAAVAALAAEIDSVRPRTGEKRPD